MAVDPKFFTNIEGTTDSELLFHLALSFGLESEPLPALERMAGFVEQLGARSKRRSVADDDRLERWREALRSSLRERSRGKPTFRQ